MSWIQLSILILSVAPYHYNYIFYLLTIFPIKVFLLSLPLLKQIILKNMIKFSK